jgi:antibiotic biosynthesis monooxygenase (ABM) superfamily enzyme
MYGTIARMRLKPGQEAAMQAMTKEYETLNVPGYVSSTIYKMDGDSSEFYMCVVFADQASYRANAESPEQNDRYQKMVEMLDGEPEWHDGEIVYSR